MQEKLVLTRMPDGAWGRPVNGTPSTHILKPELAEYPNTVENVMVGDRKLLVVTRFDRQVAPDGMTVRIHQEIAAIVSSYDPGSLDSLLSLLTLDVVLGNGDAHAKNFSLLHLIQDRQNAEVKLRLAPAYDLLPTQYYGDDKLAMHVDNVRRSTNVTRQRLANEAASWGMARNAPAIIDDILQRVPDAVDRAARDIPNVPGGVLDIIQQQLRRLA